MQVRNCQTLKDPKRTYKRNGGQIMTYDLNITFDDNLVTGNETIDTQHKELIDRIQNFVTACQNGDSKVKAIKMLDYLDEYTDFHFKEEEKLQEKSGYPEREKHYEKHEEFRKTIQELYEYLQEYEGPTDRFSELVQKNVIDWLFGHIKTYDRSVAKFIFMKQNSDQC
jgi:hemerythrin